jgi:predicted metal-dependent peptidase
VGRFDFHFDPGASQNVPPSQIPPRAEYEWDMAVKAAYEIQKAHGKMHPALEHFFDAVLRPVVDWTEHIRGLLTRIMGAGAYDWRRLDRRLITRGLGAPALSGHGAGLVIVGGDTSMSVFHDKTLVHRWLSELSGMIEDVQPEETRVLWCDTTVRRVDICSEPQDVVNLAFKGVPGGGGTNFNPVFDYVRENDLQPDVLLYLTDGDGKFPKREPEYPVIWGDISGNPRKYPFGQVVRIPIKTRAEA